MLSFYVTITADSFLAQVGFSAKRSATLRGENRKKSSAYKMI